MIKTSPIGPGFFIFFQDVKKVITDEILGGPSDAKLDSDRIMKDDNEILELITMMINCDVI